MCGCRARPVSNELYGMFCDLQRSPDITPLELHNVKPAPAQAIVARTPHGRSGSPHLMQASTPESRVSCLRVPVLITFLSFAEPWVIGCARLSSSIHQVPDSKSERVTNRNAALGSSIFGVRIVLPETARTRTTSPPCSCAQAITHLYTTRRC